MFADENQCTTGWLLRITTRQFNAAKHGAPHRECHTVKMSNDLQGSELYLKRRVQDKRNGT